MNDSCVDNKTATVTVYGATVWSPLTTKYYLIISKWVEIVSWVNPKKERNPYYFNESLLIILLLGSILELRKL